MNNVTIPLDVLTDREVIWLHRRMFLILRREQPNPQTIMSVNALRREMTKRELMK